VLMDIGCTSLEWGCGNGKKPAVSPYCKRRRA
jgi:hypothetical protein